MANKYLLFDLNDEKSKKLGEVISNSTCKKIINLLAEKEQSASEIASELKIPLNTTTYNISNLIESGLIEQSKSFWSVKGKKMPSYKVVNKAIVISPKKGNIYSKIKGVLPVIATGLIFSGFVLWKSLGERISGGEAFNSVRDTSVPAQEGLKAVVNNTLAGVSSGSAGSSVMQNVSEHAVNKTGELVGIVQSSGLSITNWFLIGIWALLLLFVVYSFMKKD